MNEDSPFVAAAPVLVPMPAERPYTYAVPAGMRVVPGSIVRVPLGPRQVAGIVWDGVTEQVDAKKLRPIEQVFDCPRSIPNRGSRACSGRFSCPIG